MFKKIKMFFGKHFEVFLISVARNILMGRNVQRAPYVSRRDNNKMWGMAEQLESVEERMKSEYENV